MGTDLYHDKEILGFFKFYGSPDLVIKQKCDKQTFPVVSTQIFNEPSSSSDEDDQESQDTETIAIENAITSDSTSRTKTRVSEKVAELLSNIHLILIKRGLKQLKEPLTNIPMRLELKGAVISCAIETKHCKYFMPIVNIHRSRHTNEQGPVSPGNNRN